jgi:hypothetical protein
MQPAVRSPTRRARPRASSIPGTISPSDTGRASTLFNAERQLAAALGVAVLSSILAAAGPTRTSAAGVVMPHLAAYQAAFLAAAGFAVLAALLALRVPDRDAAATMRRGRGEPAREEALVMD